MSSSRRFLLQTEPIGTPMTGSEPDDTTIQDSNFDTHMAIIIAALLCALICVLALNPIMRWALRFSRRFVIDAPEQSSVCSANTGIKKKALRQIPVVVYGSGQKISATECPICLGEFADGEKIRVLPKCNHGFHVGCIDTWLRSHSSCPNCRLSLLERPPTDASPSIPPLAATRSTTHQASTALPMAIFLPG